MSIENADKSKANADGEPAPRGAGGEQKDVSLGPACLVIAIIGAICLSLGVILMAAMMTGSKGRRAAYSVREQLIPWVEQSSLNPLDQQTIVGRLTELSEDMEREELTSRQLSRLAIRLSDSPILQWGVVEQLVAKTKTSESFAADEKADFIATCDRWLLAASEGKLSIQDMEFALQNVAQKEPKTGTLSVRDDVNDERLRECQRRIATICDKLNVSKEPFNKSVSQVFLKVMDEAMAEKD